MAKKNTMIKTVIERVTIGKRLLGRLHNREGCIRKYVKSVDPIINFMEADEDKNNLFYGMVSKNGNQKTNYSWHTKIFRSLSIKYVLLV